MALLRACKKGLSCLALYSAPLSATALAMSAAGFYLTFVSLLFDTMHFGSTKIGSVQAAYFLGLFLGSWKIEAIVRRVGHIQSLAACGSLLTMMFLVQALIPNFYVWIVTRILAGVGMAAFYVVIECWMLDRAEPRQRGTMLALYMVALNLGYAGGQQMLSLIDLRSMAPFMWSALITSAAILPVALSTKRLTMPEAEHGIRLTRLWRLSPFGTFGCLMAGIILSALYSFLAIAAESRGIAPQDAMMTLILGGLFLQWPLGKASDFWDRRSVFACISAATALLSCALLVFWQQSEWLLFTLLFGLGGTSFSIYPIGLAQATDHLRQTQFTKATATLLLVYGLGSVLGPLLTSLLDQFLGDVGLFATVFCSSVALTGVGVYCLFYRPALPSEEQQTFLPLPRTTSLAAEMDPRTLDE